jgi:hypothetical protein
MGSWPRKWGRRSNTAWLRCARRFERAGTAAGRGKSRTARYTPRPGPTDSSSASDFIVGDRAASYTRRSCPKGLEGRGRVRRSGVPAPEAQAVFENSTACAIRSPNGGLRDRVQVRTCRSRVAGAKNIPSDPRPARCTTPATQYGADNSLYRLVSTGDFGHQLTRQSFTESLILAQDERWRRA